MPRRHRSGVNPSEVLTLMSCLPGSRGVPSAETTFDRIRTRLLSGVQDPLLRRAAFALMAIGAGVVPLMAGAANAALQKMPTDGADTLLMLIGSALVLLMTPGLAFFYGGFVRSKNVLNTMMMSFFLMGLIGVLWVVVGYSLAFGTGNPFIGDFSQFMMNGLGGADGSAPFADGLAISASSFALFQGMFAIITPALISGALVERVSFKFWFWFCLIWSLVIYSPMAHMVWGGGFLGCLGAVGAIDFAGGTVVHIASGVAALVTAMIIGPRTSYPSSTRPPHNVPFILLGAGLLWFGWFGFNAGSALSANLLASNAFVNTNTATAAALLGWILVEKLRDGKSTTLGAASGAVAGLVAITPACGYVNVVGATIIGLVAGAICALAVRAKFALKLDDALDVGGVHFVGGVIGALLIGFFGTKAIGGVNGIFHGGSASLLGNQALAVVVVAAYSFIVSWLLAQAIHKTIGFRITEEQEYEGMDTALHAETAYDFSPGVGAR